MTSFEIECPRSFHDCDRIDVYPEHKTTHTEFHLIYEGELLSVIQKDRSGQWYNASGKALTVDEIAFIQAQIESMQI